MYTNDSATLFTRTAGTETYTRTYINEVYWSSTLGTKPGPASDLRASHFTVFIPLGTAESLSVKKGDVIARGKVEKTISDAYTISALRKDYPQSGTITYVDLNDAGSTQVRHYELGVD